MRFGGKSKNSLLKEIGKNREPAVMREGGAAFGKMKEWEDKHTWIVKYKSISKSRSKTTCHGKEVNPSTAKTT